MRREAEMRKNELALAAVFGLLLVACGGQTAPQGAASTAPLVSIQVGYASVSATQAGAWIAKDQGIFTKYGLDVTLQSIAGGSNPTAALISGQIQALQISVEAISASLEGADLVYVAAPVSSPLFWFMSQPSITDPSQLKGKKIAATGVGTASYFADVVALRSLGLDPAKDVSIISVNNVPAILAVIQSGQVAAGALSMPTFALGERAGLKLMVDVAKLGVRYPSSWLAVRKSYIKDHRDQVMALVKSITEAISFELLRPAETMRVIGKYAQISDQAILTETYQTLSPYLNRVPAPKAGEADEALKLLTLNTSKAASARGKDFVDTSFVDQLQKQGFIDKLYAGKQT